ncbi:MAG: hypothetical protein Q9199_005542 [Rusavskia elegans]
MSLEVDQPGKESITLYVPYGGKEVINGTAYQLLSSEAAPTTSPAQYSSRRLSIVPALLAALAIVTILAIVAAAVVGSTAIQRQNDIDSLRQQLEDSTDALKRYMKDSANSSNITSLPAKLSDIKPASNCSEIGDKKTYVSAFQKMPFTVHCDTDYPGSDILGIWMFNFADCMEACASWNAFRNSPQCYSVSYDISDAFAEEAGVEYCFFKGNRNIQARRKTVTSSADAQLSGDS